MRIKLLDLDLIRRYNAIELNVDPSVAKILLNKGVALDLTKPTIQKLEVIEPILSEIKIESKVIKLENYIFPENIIPMKEK